MIECIILKSDDRIDSTNEKSSVKSHEDSYKLKNGTRSPSAVKGNKKVESQLTSSEIDGESSSEEDTENSSEIKNNGKILAPPKARVTSTVEMGKPSKASQKKAPSKAPLSKIQKPEAQTKILDLKSSDADIDDNASDGEYPAPAL